MKPERPRGEPADALLPRAGYNARADAARKGKDKHAYLAALAGSVPLLSFASSATPDCMDIRYTPAGSGGGAL